MNNELRYKNIIGMNKNIANIADFVKKNELKLKKKWKWNKKYKEEI